MSVYYVPRDETRPDSTSYISTALGYRHSAGTRQMISGKFSRSETPPGPIGWYTTTVLHTPQGDPESGSCFLEPDALLFLKAGGGQSSALRVHCPRVHHATEGREAGRLHSRMPGVPKPASQASQVSTYRTQTPLLPWTSLPPCRRKTIQGTVPFPVYVLRTAYCVLRQVGLVVCTCTLYASLSTQGVGRGETRSDASSRIGKPPLVASVMRGRDRQTQRKGRKKKG